MPDKSTQPRLDAMKVSPDLYKAMLGLEKYIEASGLDQKLLDLVKIRASQINGCAYCIVMHTNDARKHGEQRRMDAPAQCLARGADLHGARACSPRLDGSGDKDRRPSRAG